MRTPPYRLIESFLSFATAPNMVEAARRLEMSQPALTHHLKLFQTYFPRPVFTQVGRRKVLTDFGIDLQEMLQDRFGVLRRDLIEIQQRVQNPQDVVVRIGGRSEILKYLAPRLTFPGTLIFISMDGKKGVQGLIDRDFDIAISNHLEKASQLISRKFLTDRWALVAPKNWRLSGRVIESAHLEMLAQKPFLAYKETDRMVLRLYGFFDLHTAGPRHAKIIEDWGALTDLVAADQAWAIVPDRFAIGRPNLSVLEIPEEILPPTDFFLLYRKEISAMPWWNSLRKQLNSDVSR